MAYNDEYSFKRETQDERLFGLGVFMTEACLAFLDSASPDPDDRRPETPGARATPNDHAVHAALTILYAAQPLRAATQRHDALLCCHAHAPHYCLPLLPHRLCYSAATALFRTTTAATCTLMAANKEERAASLFRRSPKANFPTSETHAPRAMSVPGPSRDRRSPRARPPPRGLSYVFVTRNRMYTARPHGPPNGAPAAAGAELGEGQRKRASRRLSTLVVSAPRLGLGGALIRATKLTHM